MKTIIRVVARNVGSEKNAGYSYTAEFDDGTTQIIRKKATRLYENAFMYGDIADIATATNLSHFFSFGKKPAAWWFDLTKSFKVEFIVEDIVVA